MMRGVAYAVAAIAAVGIMIGIATMSPESGQEDGDAAQVASADVATVSAGPAEQAGQMTLAVPDMHCSVSCFPRIKKTLESESMVNAVELGPQKEEGVIDNRQIVVSYDAGFDVTEAMGLLKKEGFDSEVVQ